MINIFLDDIRPCPDNYIPARSYDEMIKLLRENKGNIKNISLDHDLGEIRSGYDVSFRCTGNATTFNKICSKNLLCSR